MKYITTIAIGIIALCSPTYGSSETANVVFEIIEFDFTEYPNEFKMFANDFRKSDPLSYHFQLKEWKSKEFPWETIIRHTQSLRIGDHIIQSTELKGSGFDLDILRNDDQSDMVDIKVKFSVRYGGKETSVESQTCLEEDCPRVFSINYQTSNSRSEDGILTTNRIVRLIQASLEK